MNRKETVKLLSEHFGVKPKYMGTPSFAYEIETKEGIITINRTGKIINSEGNELELETILNGTVEEEIIEVQEQEEDKTTTAETQSVPSEISSPIEGHIGTTLRNLVNMIYSKQILIKKSLGLTDDIVDEDFIKAINKVKFETVEDFKTAIEDIGKEKHKGIEFDFEGNMILFKFLKLEVDTEKFKAYSQFAELLNETSKKLKHASAKVKSTDNEKFTMRTWLIRLGMIDDEYKITRKILLENLEGNGAFRYGKTEK